MRSRLTPGVLAVTVALLAGCGVGTDDAPRAIPREQVGFDLLEESPTSSTAPPANAVTRNIYLIGGGDSLVEAPREVQAPAVVEDMLQSLLDPVTDEEAAANLSSSIPPGTRLRSVSPAEGEGEGVVGIDLTSELYNVQGPRLTQALAQIVFTATEGSVDPEDKRVQISVDGQPRDIPDASGATKSVVIRNDYKSLDRGR